MRFYKVSNPIVRIIILLFFAQSFNDWWSVKVGFPTPVQIVLIYGIIQNHIHSTVAVKYRKLKILKVYFVLYMAIVVVYSFFALFNDRNWQNGITIIMNFIWLISSIPLLQKGITVIDWSYLKQKVLLIVGLVTIPSGLYELISHNHIISSQFGLSDETFYIRGLHLDKLEFGSYLCIGFFITLSDFLTKKGNEDRKILWNLYIFILCFVLTLFSFSTTSTAGLLIGGLYIMGRNIRSKLYPLFILLSFLTIGYGVISSNSFKNLKSSYELKYDIGVGNLQEKNFRYLAFKYGFQKIIEQPFLGYGIGQSGEQIKLALKLNKPINSHNLLINEILDFGFIFSFPLMIILLQVFRMSFTKPINRSDLVLKNMSPIIRALAILIVLRFIFYYHRFDQTVYLFWISLVILFYATNNYGKYRKTSKESRQMFKNISLYKTVGQRRSRNGGA